MVRSRSWSCSSLGQRPSREVKVQPCFHPWHWLFTAPTSRDIVPLSMMPTPSPTSFKLHKYKAWSLIPRIHPTPKLKKNNWDQIKEKNLDLNLKKKAIVSESPLSTPHLFFLIIWTCFTLGILDQYSGYLETDRSWGELTHWQMVNAWTVGKSHLVSWWNLLFCQTFGAY